MFETRDLLMGSMDLSTYILYRTQMNTITHLSIYPADMCTHWFNSPSTYPTGLLMHPLIQLSPYTIKSSTWSGQPWSRMTAPTYQSNYSTFSSQLGSGEKGPHKPIDCFVFWVSFVIIRGNSFFLLRRKKKILCKTIWFKGQLEDN